MCLHNTVVRNGETVVFDSDIDLIVKGVNPITGKPLPATHRPFGILEDLLSSVAKAF